MTYFAVKRIFVGWCDCLYRNALHFSGADRRKILRSPFTVKWATIVLFAYSLKSIGGND